MVKAFCRATPFVYQHIMDMAENEKIIMKQRVQMRLSALEAVGNSGADPKQAKCTMPETERNSGADPKQAKCTMPETERNSGADPKPATNSRSTYAPPVVYTTGASCCIACINWIRRMDLMDARLASPLPGMYCTHQLPGLKIFICSLLDRLLAQGFARRCTGGNRRML